MAYRIPVISTNAGGIPELIGNGAGIMVRQRDAEGIADMIANLMIDQHLSNILGEKGRGRIKENFNLRTNVKKVLAMMNYRNIS